MDKMRLIAIVASKGIVSLKEVGLKIVWLSGQNFIQWHSDIHCKAWRERNNNAAKYYNLIKKFKNIKIGHLGTFYWCQILGI